MNKSRATLTAVLSSAALAACGNGGAEADEPELRFVEGQGSLEELDREQRSIASQSVRALAEHLDIPMADIRIDTVRAVNWRDTSIGCPQPDQAYGQVITPGYKVTLRVEKALHFVHAANERVFVCETAGKPLFSSVDTESQLVWGEQMLWARADLAEHLGADEAEITIRSALPKTFSDASLDCPEPDVEYDATAREGFALNFEYRGRTYTYNTDLTRTVLCPPITVD
ncbi:MAG: hypothetical protein AAFZ58_09710 [Pseudomonadota bacterium]